MNGWIYDIRRFEPRVQQVPAALGWVLGAGYEVALTRWLMVKAEYLHYDLGSNSTTVTYDYPPNTSTMTGKVHDEGNIVRVGVNFKLGHPNSAP